VLIRSVAVLGAGTMGAQIAAHFANAGTPALLLDLTKDAAVQGLGRAQALKPDPFFAPDTVKLITTGSFDADLARISEADWVVEAVVERLDIKRGLLERVDTARRSGSIVTSNTSGISIAALAEGRSIDFRRHWLGTHFFNPPRYLHLLEVIPTAETNQAVVDAVLQFADHRLGKGVVIAKDSPGFIGNHIGLYGLLRIISSVARGDCTIEEADEMTGPALGRPKSATFRTIDLTGLDVLAHVVDDLHRRLPDPAARAGFTLPEFVREMLRRGLIGEKAGQGFYKRVKAPGGESEILTLDPATLEYRPRRIARLPAIDAARSVTDPGSRVRMLFSGNDRVGEFLRDTLAPMLVYAAKVLPSVAHSADDVDRVMRWGFGWEIGAFELSDAIGVSQVVDASRRSSPELLEPQVPDLFQQVIQTGVNRLRDGAISPAGPGLEILRASRSRRAPVKKNAGASLIDLGDGVLCVEFHSKMNVIGGDTIQMLHAGVREASANFAALVVGNESSNFSAGANLMLLLLEAQEQNWEEIDLMIRSFQQATMALRYSDVPVVVAPAGLTLGGGCEIALHADRIQAAGEAYLGLVELSVGLVPAGGGTKEMVARAADSMPAAATDYLPPIQQVFETIALAKVSGSGPDAARIGYLQPTDAVTMNRDRLIAEAKARALQRVSEGYHRPVPRTAIRVGGETVLAPLKLGVHLALRAGRISEYDALVGRRLATIMAGGALPHRSILTEQQLLDLEREAFLSLVGEPKTQARIQHTLRTGRPLRN
jgi:3-hydroxyacyl-CoA dehydrogenase